MRKIEHKISLDFNLKFEDIKDLNPSFATAKVAIAYPGRNRNYSLISKDTFEKAIPSLKYIPLVGHYIPEENDFGAHDIRVVNSEDGKSEIVNATVPFGVVPSESNVEWKTVTETDGTEREYIFCDVLLWKRQYGYECLASKDTWHQSMEIKVNSFVLDHEGYCVIEDMTFEALCILGENVEPCFQSASVQMNTDKAVSDYKAQFSQMLDELRQFEVFAQNKEDKDKLNEEMKAGILAEYGLTLDSLNFEITDGMTEQEFRIKLDEMKVALKQPDTQEPVNFAATYKQKRMALSNVVDLQRGQGSEQGQDIYYYLEDFDDTHVFVQRHVYSANGYEEKVGRFAYSYDEKAASATLAGDFEEMVVQWLTLAENEKLQQSRNAFATLQQEFDGYKKAYCTKESEVEELRQFKASRAEQDHKNEVDSVLAEFESICDNEEFLELSKKDSDGHCKAYDYETADALRKDCYAIVGKTASSKFVKQPTKRGVVKVPIKEQPVVESRYGDLFQRYG